MIEQLDTIYKQIYTDGTIIQFGPLSGNVAVASTITQPNGIVHTLTWTGGPKRLTRVVSNAGYALTLEYGGAAVSKACVYNTSVVAPGATCPAGVPTALYGYDGSGRLTAVTNPAGGLSQTVWSGNAEALYKPGYAAPWLTNTYGSPMPADPVGFSQSVVLNQTFGDGRTLAYSYHNYGQPIDGVPGPFNTGRGTGWVENGQATTVLDWGIRQQSLPDNPGPLYVSPAPEMITDPLGRWTSNEFGGGAATPYDRVVARATSDGRGETFAYAATGLSRRTAIPSTTANGEESQSTSFTYRSGCVVGPDCAKPVTMTDPKLNVTDYTYDPVHGGMLSETLPAGPNGVRPRKTYAWSQHAAAGGGSVWLVDTIRECRTQTACAGTADEVVTTLAYGAGSGSNGVLPLSRTVAAGAGGLSATVSWSYDANGDKLTEDGPLAGTADTTRWRYDALRRVVGVITPDPDAAGSGNPHLATRNSYDPAGRLISVEQGKVTDQTDAAWAAFVAHARVDTE